MKKIKKFLALLLIALMVPFMMVGCKTKTPAPDETAKALTDLVIKGDNVSAKKMGVPENDINDVLKMQKDTYLKEFKAVFDGQGWPITDARVEEIYNSMMGALAKSTITMETVSKDKDKAQVKVKTTYFDLAAVSEKAVTDVTTQFADTKITDETELKKQVAEAFCNSLIKGFKEASFSKDTKEKTFDFVLKDKIWQPEDAKSFGEDVMSLITAQ